MIEEKKKAARRSIVLYPSIKPWINESKAFIEEGRDASPVHRPTTTMIAKLKRRRGVRT